MSNDVQSHEDVAGRTAGEDRRAGFRHAARSLGSVTARIIGGSQVELVNFSNRGVLFECDSRLLIGARASVRITTTDANLIITGRVVRSRVKGLVDGALRYDAALVLDTELGLVPTIMDTLPDRRANAADDELTALEAELDHAIAPSPVEAYLAESEASLLDVAPSSELLLHTTDYAEPAVAPALEPEPEPEPIAFEADAEIAFEPAIEFAFDDGVEPSFETDPPLEATEAGTDVLQTDPIDDVATGEPAGTSMFDATYMPPAVDDVVAPESQFDVRRPSAVAEPMPSSFFDAHPSEHYGSEPPVEAAVTFEAEEIVTFDAAAPPDVPLDVLTDAPAPVADTEDRVLLQFAATVPHDLAELRRIAADNQW